MPSPAFNTDIPVLAFRLNNWRVIVNSREINIKDIQSETDAAEVIGYLKKLAETVE